jgi:hypothetical protein
MICKVCGIEFGGEFCPQCVRREEGDGAEVAILARPEPRGETTIQDMLKSPDRISESADVIRLKQEKCAKCQLQLASL